MFGWMKKRIRREHIKLAKQNELASDYLANMMETAAELGVADNDDLLGRLQMMRFKAGMALTDLEGFSELPQQDFEFLIQVNKALRSLYDQARTGRNQARTLTGNPETLLPFDKAFQPPGGWKTFLDQHPDSTEDILRGYMK